MSEGAVPTPVTIEELLAQARWIRRLASQLVVGEDAADELAQAGIVQALTNPPRHSGNLRAWFAVVLRNLARHQGASLRREREERAASAELGRAEHESSEQIVMRLETQQLVGEALLKLEPAHRDVLVLRFYDELSFREISERLNIPQATARSRTERALEELRKRLDLLGGSAELDWRAGVALWVATGWRRGAPAAQAGSPAVPIVLASFLALTAAVAWWAPWRAADAPDEPVAITAPAVEGTAGPAVVTVADRRTVVPQPEKPALLESRLRYEGRVLRDDTGEPLAGARVRLLFDGGYHRAASVLRTTTDEAGRFVLEGAPSPYQPGTGDLLSYYPFTVVLRVEHDGRFASYEASEVIPQLTRWRSGDAPVEHHRGDLRLARAVQPAAILSGDWAERGGIWLADVPDSTRALTRWRQVGEWDGALRVTWWDTLGARLLDDAPLVLLAWDGTRFAALDLDLPPDGDATRELVFEASPVTRVEVTLLDPEGAPIVGRRVMAHPASWPLRARHAPDQCEHRTIQLPTGFHAARIATTDEHGVAAFPALTAAPLGVAHEVRPRISGDGLFPGGTWIFCAPELEEAGVLLSHRASLPVRLHEDEALALRLVFGDEDRGLTGVVVDAQQRPLADLEVVAADYAHSDPLLNSGSRRGTTIARTDAQGRFTLIGVDEQGQGFEELRFKGADFGVANLELLVPVPAQGVSDLGVIVLPTAHPVRGWLVDELGEPVASDAIQVGCRSLGLDPDHPLGGRPERTNVHADGSFGWDALPAGPKLLYPLGFAAAGLQPFEPVEFDPAGSEFNVVVQRFEDARTQVRLTISSDGDTDAALRSAVALLERDGAPPVLMAGEVGADARSVEWRALHPGAWWIGVELHGGDRVWRSLVLDGSQPSVRRDLRLSSEGSLVGSVGEVASAARLAGSVVEARLVGPCTADGGPDVERELGAPRLRARVEGNGSFRFEDLRPGRYELRLVEGAVVARGAVEVAAGVETRAQLSPRPARRLVLEGDPGPFLDQRLRLALVLTDADGSRYAWPIRVGEDGAVAEIPASATSWSATWWAPAADRGAVPAVALPGRTGGRLTPGEVGDVDGPLPR